MSGPNSAPEIGQQSYRTPRAFVAGLVRRFGLPATGFAWDLACDTDNCLGSVGGYTFNTGIDALAQDWTELAGLGDAFVSFLNPPFAQSGVFAAKCASSGARIVALVPVALGTMWWRQHVDGHAHIEGVGRIVFDLPDGSGPVVGVTGKPQAINRDCAVLTYNIRAERPRAFLQDFRTW